MTIVLMTIAIHKNNIVVKQMLAFKKSLSVHTHWPTGCQLVIIGEESMTYTHLDNSDMYSKRWICCIIKTGSLFPDLKITSIWRDNSRLHNLQATN